MMIVMKTVTLYTSLALVFALSTWVLKDMIKDWIQ